MKLTIDSPVSVSVRQSERGASITLAMLGGSLWFPAASCPSGINSGMYKGADIEVSLRTIPSDGRVRAFFSPVRLLSLK